MHEFSIAMNIVELATEAAKKEKATKISALELEVGTMSGIVIEALEFAWESATKDSILKHAVLNIKVVQAQAKCEACGHIFSLKGIEDACPKCNTFEKQIVAGKELKIISLEVE